MPNRIWYLLSIKLSGEATQAELDEFHHLLEMHPELEASIQQITRYWMQPNPDPENTPDHHNQAHWHRHLERLRNSGADWTDTPQAPLMVSLPEHASGKRKWFWWAAAAIVLLCIGAWWLSIPDNSMSGETTLAKTSRNEIITRPASRTQLTLPDGSKVWLNASSKLTYSNGFGEENRNVWLEGEAYFNVFKNKALPFIIHTSRMNIRVTGTVFNVRAYPQEPTSETALIEGSVEVALAGEKDWKYQLKPRQKLVVDDHGISYKDSPAGGSIKRGATVPSFTASLQQFSKPLADSQVVETAWVYNLLSFSDESFRQVANKMEKWYGIVIRFSEPDMENWYFTGSFRTETLTQALTALQFSTAFSFVVKENEVIISKPHNK